LGVIGGAHLRIERMCARNQSATQLKKALAEEYSMESRLLILLHCIYQQRLCLGYVEDRLHNQNSGSEFEKAVQQKQTQIPISAPPPVAPVNSQAAMPTNNLLLPPITPPPGTPVAPTNAPAAPAKSK